MNEKEEYKNESNSLEYIQKSSKIHITPLLWIWQSDFDATWSDTQ